MIIAVVRIAARYGSPPTVTYYDSSVTVDPSSITHT